MLETVRAYAAQRFTAIADQEAVRKRHYRYFLALAERHGTERALDGAGRKDHFARLDAESDNLNAALDWALDQPDSEASLAIVAAAGWYWLMRDRAATLDRIDHALGLPGAERHPALRIRALCIKFVCARLLRQTPEQPAIAVQAESLARGLGDPVLLSQALTTRAHEAALDGRSQVAVALADEALVWARAAGDEWEIACAARARAAAAATAPELRDRVDRAARLMYDVGNTYQLVHMLSSAARRALSIGSDVDARDFIDRAIPLADARG
jgi:hypothetical protein